MSKERVNVREWLTSYAQEKNYEDIDDSLLEEILREEGETVYTGSPDHRRWYYEFERVVKIDDKYFSFTDASTNSEHPLRVCGYVFNWSEVTEVFPTVITKIVYQ